MRAAIGSSAHDLHYDVSVNSQSHNDEDPPSSDIVRLMREGDEHFRQGRGTQADACFRTVLAREPGNPDALHRCGILAFLRGDARQAVEFLREAVSTRSDDAALRGHLANALMACGDLDNAIANWRRALEIAPDYAAAHARIGDAYFAKGDIDASEAAYRKSIEVNPENAKAFVGLGRVLHFGDRNDEAETALQRALELDGNAPEVCVLVGTVLLEAGALDAARELFESAVRAQPEEPRAHASMGLALHWQGRFDEAENAYRRALSIDPGNPLALKHLGVLYQERDQLKAAAECFEKLLRVNPHDEVARHMLAATTGDTTANAPRGYVTRLYDDYADRFDAHLEAIDYRVPTLIRDAVLEVTKTENPAWRVLDLGCGTGQCGEVIRPLADFLAGVDLSPRMIAKARERNVYDSLVVASIDDVFEGNEQRFDLIVAGDVFIYIGDLSNVLASCSRTLTAGGLVAFSIESSDTDSYRLCPTGRYAHSAAYIETIANASGLSVVYAQDIIVRNDPIPIPGQILVLENAARS